MLSQDEPVSEQSAESYKSRLWIFHKNGVSIHSIGCSGLLHGKRTWLLFCYLNSDLAELYTKFTTRSTNCAHFGAFCNAKRNCLEVDFGAF